MPNRLVRDGILTSRRVDALTDAEEVFYRRLMSVVDDFGRFFASADLIISACYPLRVKRVSAKMIESRLQALESNRLITRYQASGEPYLELIDFRQQVRTVKSKYPDPDGSQPVSPVAQPKPHPKREHLNGAFLSFWQAYPRHINRADAEKEWLALAPDESLTAQIVAAVETQKRSNDWIKEDGKWIPHAFRWLKKRRWEDVLQSGHADGLRRGVTGERLPEV